MFYFILASSNASKSLPTGIDVHEYKHLGKNILTFDEIAEKFDDATVHYGKVSEDWIISMFSFFPKYSISMYVLYIDNSSMIQICTSYVISSYI